MHAVTKDGVLLIASLTGSQIGAYVYGAGKVVFIISTQKLVDNIEQGKQRIYEHVLPQESVRVQKVYGMPASAVNKLVEFHAEMPGRVTILLVNEKLGY